jgi:hypothetical protein
VSRLCQGSIIWATIVDPAGGNPKSRPAVIITATNELDHCKPFVAVAVSSSIQSDPHSCVELPWHAQGHPKTGLNKRCWAITNWLVALEFEHVQQIVGVVPNAVLLEIVRKATG